MKKTHLQGIGKHDAIEAINLEVGMIIVWNFGYKSIVEGIEISNTRKTLTVYTRSLESGEAYSRRMTATRLVAIESADENSKEESEMSTTTATTTNNVEITFTLNDGTTYTKFTSGYCTKGIMENGMPKIKRTSSKELDEAYSQYVMESKASVEESETTEEVETIQRENPVEENPVEENPVEENPVEENPVEAEEKTKKERKSRKSKDVAFTWDKDGKTFTLTAKQLDFIRHLEDTVFWEDGVDSVIWIDVLCEDISGQFANKPMTVGAMISTLCEKGLGVRTKCKRERKTLVTFELTDLGKAVVKNILGE